MNCQQRRNKFPIAGFIFAILFFGIVNAYANDENIEAIYNTESLSDQEKYDSIIGSYVLKLPPVKQLSTLDYIINLAKNNNDDFFLYVGYFFKGNAYIYLAEPEKACKYYFKSIDKLQGSNSKHRLYSAYFGLGNAYSLSNDHKQSIVFYKKALGAIDSSNQMHVGYIYLNIVDEFVQIQKIDSAEFYLKKADSIFNTVDDNIGDAFVQGQKAILYVKNGAFISAEKCFAKTDSLLHIEEDEYSIISFQIELAKSYLLQKQFTRALDNLLESYHKAKELGFNEQTRDISLLLSEAYSNLGEYEKAYLYQKEYIVLNDSICNENSFRKIADIRTEYEVSQKQLEIDLLNKKRQLNRIIIIAIIIILLVVSFLTYLINKHLKIVKKQRKKLIQQKQELEELIRTKDKMFSIISHDLRGPLHSLSGIPGLIRELIKNDNKDILVDVGDSLGKSLSSITLLLDNLLEWSLNQQGKIPLNPEKLDAYNLFVELYEIFYGPTEAKGIELILAVEKDTFLVADQNTFSTIFRNLISNAVKFSNKGDKITLGVSTTSDKITFSVTDTGVGMDRKKQDNIFDFTGTKSTYGTGQERGIGLGLRLAYEFTKLNKGEITVESKEGKGTTFFVEFLK